MGLSILTEAVTTMAIAMEAVISDRQEAIRDWSDGVVSDWVTDLGLTRARSSRRLEAAC